MFWAECKQLWGEGVKVYFSQMWNYMDITMLSLYTASYAIEAVIYTKVTLIHSRHPLSKGDISMGGCVRLLVFLNPCLNCTFHLNANTSRTVDKLLAYASRTQRTACSLGTGKLAS